MSRIVQCLCACLALLATARAELKLPNLFTDHMVLQRDMATPVWGWATPGATITVQFAGQTQTAVAAADGRWALRLEPLAVSAEGRTLQVSGDGAELAIQDVLVGEVWLCSGQSNMEWPVAAALDKDAEIAAAQYPLIRLLQVSKAVSPTPQDSFAGKWQVCAPATIGRFSAVGYYFGRHLYRTLEVPVGLIHSSWGGTPAQAWTSAPALRAKLPVFAGELDRLTRTEASGDAASYQERVAARAKAIEDLYTYEENVLALTAQVQAEDPRDWKTMRIPGNWEGQGHAGLDGAVWFRCTITVPGLWIEQDLDIELGPVDEVETTFFNGEMVGSTGSSRKGDVDMWDKPRTHRVPGRLVKAGENEIAVLVSDLHGEGGMWGGDPQARRVVLADDPKGESVPLAGDWRYRVAHAVPPVPYNSQNPGRPSVLYNSMIAPLVPYAMRGAIWYQGEANAGNPTQYRILLPAMIADWRQAWGQGDFPFLVVQLANFMQATQNAGDSGNWSGLREAQALTAAADPTVGLALAIDIGEAADIHPRNKQEVGRRLGLVAEHIAYDRELVYSGPVFTAMTVADGRAILAFDHADGLVLKRDPATHSSFAIAGADGVWHWAEPAIQDGKVVLSSPAVPVPTAVRYAWANNPPSTLYNGAGLPAVPFQTGVAE